MRLVARLVLLLPLVGFAAAAVMIPGAFEHVAIVRPAIAAGAPAQQMVIIDTDIGDDFDDALALGLALSSPVDDKGFTRPVAGAANSFVCLGSDADKFFNFYMARMMQQRLAARASGDLRAKKRGWPGQARP